MQHLFIALQQVYDITIDWSGTNLYELNIEWNYNAQWVDISMPNYTRKTLTKINHTPPTYPQYTPYQWTVPAYGKKRQFAKELDKASPLDKHGTKRIQ